jgi:hypothetical protein
MVRAQSEVGSRDGWTCGDTAAVAQAAGRAAGGVAWGAAGGACDDSDEDSEGEDAILAKKRKKPKRINPSEIHTHTPTHDTSACTLSSPPFR